MAEFVPCPDESCMGVIGPDGLCTECGAPGPELAEELGGGREDRVPCPDGACIGVAGSDGLCTECGRRVTGGGHGGPLRGSTGPEERQPCPDGACIGLIGPDGRCAECGRRAEASEDALADEDEGDEEGDAWAGGEGDPEDRVPCPDGSCIGIIGPNGRCTECGRRPS